MLAPAPQEHEVPASTRWRSPIGAHRVGELGPNSASVGTPKPAAKCNGPVSPEIKTFARFNTARNRDRSGTTGTTGALGASFLNSTINDCSRAPVGVVKASRHPTVAANR